MKLRHIEIKGFKSFVKKETLVFQKRITAIVGPNGSGKSNIAEAFRFVLGEQSMKSMRSKKTEDLLFNGSSTIQRVNRASVLLRFDNSKRQIKSAFDTIEIERVIHRDATNEYFINGSRVRLKDVTDMLSQAKIGTSGHSIISQGEADKMISISPKDRRVYLEEALGLVQYQNKKSESLKKLEKTEENIVSINLLLKELAPHLKYLEREIKLIEKKELLSTELITLSKSYISKTIPTLEGLLSKKQEELRGVLEEIRIISKEQEKEPERSTNESLSHKIRLKEEALGAANRHLYTLREQRASLERLLGRAEARLEFLKEKDGQNNEFQKKEIPVTTEKVQQAKTLFHHILKEEHLEKIHTLAESGIVILTPEKESEDNLLVDQSESQTPQREIENISAQLEEIVTEEEKAVERKSVVEKDLSEMKHLSVSQKDSENRLLFEMRALESLKQSLMRDIESLEQEKNYFFASLEEVALLTRHSLKDDVQEASRGTVSYPQSEIKETERGVEKLKLALEAIQVGDTQAVRKEYASAKEREAFLLREIHDLKETSDKLRVLIKDLERRVEVEFEEGLEKINSFFTTFFSHMFKGGSARLVPAVLKRQDENGEEENVGLGVDVAIEMTHKKLKSIAMLSGGEKTLVSIALIFALTQVNPPPFILLDETDAALDEANSKRYGDALEELARHSQLILITHNRETMSRANMLYGITMGKSAFSELLSIDLDEAEKITR